MNQQRMPKIAVVGAGYWGRNHVRVHHQLGSLAAVCDGRPQTLDEVAQAYPEVRCVTNLEDLAELGVEGVVLATPASTHEDLALLAMELGMHVLVEKPAAQSLEGAKRLVSAARERGSVLMAGHLLLYHPALHAAKRVLEAGTIGRILYVFGQRVNLGRVRTDEDVVSSLAAHDLSMIHYLLGLEAESARTTAISVIDKPQPFCDVAFVSVTYRGGLVGHFHFSWLDPFKRREIVVVGESGMLVFDDMQKTGKLRLYDKSVVPTGTQSYDEFLKAIEVRDRGFTAPPYDEGEPLRLEAEDFLAAIRGQRKPVAGEASILAVTSAMDLIRASMNPSPTR